MRVGGWFPTRRVLQAVVLLVGMATSARAQAPLWVRIGGAQFPSSLRWWKLVTPHFDVIYPDSMAAEAQRAAALLERAYLPLGKTLDRSPDRIPVVLNNQSAISNAFVSWAPRRSEWYAIPPGGLDEFGPVDWFSLLAVHEGRHIVQEDAVRDGWVGLVSRMFGEGTTAFVAGSLYFPAWFWEGDAVGTETALSNAGRGRQPSFGNRIRTLRLNGDRYPYYAAWNGSYRTFYPDWYQLGYVLTTHVKRVYGADAWRKAIASASRWPIPPLAISHGLKKATGKSLTQIHRDAIHELDLLWRAQVAGLDTTAATPRSPANADYHGWRLPQYAGDGSIVAEYWDMSSVPSLVRLKDGKQETLVRQFPTRGEQQFDVVGDKVVWSELEVDPRFVQRGYLTLRMLDLRTRQVHRLTSGARHFAAVLSPDARRVAAVRFTEGGRTFVDIIDSESGATVQSLPNSDDHFLATPAWSPDGESIYVVALDRHHARGNALVRVPLDGAPPDTVIPFRLDAIVRPVLRGDWVYYGSPASGIDNIEATNLKTGTRFQVTSRRYAARGATVSADGAHLLFQDYGEDGYDIAEMRIDSGAFRPVDSVRRRDVAYYAPLLDQEAVAPAQQPLEPTEWKAVPYDGLERIFKFHSLSLAPSGDGHNQGLVLQSRNVLNTFATSVGAIANLAEHTGSFELGASYAAHVPIFDGALRYGTRASVADLDSTRVRYHWSERSAQVGVRLPYVRVRGLTTERLSASAAVGYTWVDGKTFNSRFSNNNGSFLPLTYTVAGSRFVESATRDILPRGASGSLVYRHTPLEGDYQGHQLSVQGALFLPGLVRHHGVVLEAQREEQRRVNYLFSSLYDVSRGYDAFTAERFERVGVTYAFPLFYPDFAVGPFAYFRRVQGAAYYDYGYAARRDNSVHLLLRSFGGEITTDMSPIQLRSTMRLGLRVNYRVDELPHVRNNLLISLPF